MAGIASPFSTYSDTTPQKRVITDVVSLIDPTDTPAIENIGGLDGGASKFRFVNWPGTTVEWLEDSLFPLADSLNGSITSTLATITVADATIFKEGDIIEVEAEQMWVSAVASSTTLEVTRNYAGTQATHTTALAVTIVGQARLEGQESHDRAFTDRTVGSNYTQIFHEEVKVTRTHNQLSQYGVGNEMEYQARKTVPSVMRLVERALFKGARKAGSATTPRAMGGFSTFITNNTVSAGGSVVEADFEDSLQASFDDGGVGPWIGFVSPSNYSNVKDIYNNSTYLKVDPGIQTLGMVIKNVVTPFGEIALVLDRWATNDKIFIVDPKNAGMLTYYPFTREPLAKTGDFEREEVVGEFTLAVRQDKSHAVITAITPA